MNFEPRVWVLNLDAEHELETLGRYTPSRSMQDLVARQRRRLLGNLVAPGDLVLTEDELESGVDLSQLSGLAWCPTPRALALLSAAGVRTPVSPSLETLRKVNARPFAARVRTPLVESSFAKNVALTLEEVRSHLSRPTADGWLVRRCFGAAGRGRRRIAAGVPSPGEVSWITAGLRSGPLLIEPWVQVTREYTRSGWVTQAGEVVISPPCFQETTSSGAWTRTDPALPGDVSRSDDARLEEAVAAAGHALAEEGYFGAFGIDAFCHKHPGRPGAREVLNPMSEINARFTMDWTLGMAGREPHRVSPSLTSSLSR